MVKTFSSAYPTGSVFLQGIKGERGYPGPSGEKGDEVSELDI